MAEINTTQVPTNNNEVPINNEVPNNTAAAVGNEKKKGNTKLRKTELDCGCFSFRRLTVDDGNALTLIDNKNSVGIRENFSEIAELKQLAEQQKGGAGVKKGSGGGAGGSNNSGIGDECKHKRKVKVVVEPSYVANNSGIGDECKHKRKVKVVVEPSDVEHIFNPENPHYCSIM